MRINVITNCTARKAIEPALHLRAETLPKNKGFAALAKEWNSRLAIAQRRIPAGDLYLGRAFREATKAARLAGTRLHIVSAGLGLITEDDVIPSYSLTLASHHLDAIGRHLDDESNTKEQDWWQALLHSSADRRSIADCLKTSRGAIFVLALSAIYLRLVSQDLLRLDSEYLQLLRIVGPRRECDVPGGLRAFYMPYDDRLDGPASPVRGTESDFPQRAALHFVQLALSHGGTTTLAGHRKMVERAIDKWPHRQTVKRERLSDAQLQHAIAQVLRESNHRRSKALRILRDERGIACEQKRFIKICNQLAEPKG